MILIFTFCLYYVLHERHRQIITPVLVPDPYESMIPKSEDDISSSTHLPQSKFIGFSDYRFVVCIILLILVGLLSIPIFGLTGFHVFLIARGRTTNEQMTKKYQTHGDVFTKGFFGNFFYLFCQPLYPQLKEPKPKRYNVELFEKMAYERNRLSNGKKKSTKKISTEVNYKKAKEDEDIQPKRKKKKVIRHENGQKNTIPTIQVNPMEEKGRVYRIILFNKNFIS